jgi:glycine hydroxymethyltransferase
VDRETGLIDYDALARQANEVKPKLLVAGGSAYPRAFDFERMRTIADSVAARFLVDMAHFAGLVAAGVHPSPLPHADIVTCTTTKTMRGPRGGLILSKDDVWRSKLQSAIFPGIQGSLHTQVIAAKAVCLGEALKPEFTDYGKRVKANARTLAATLQSRAIKVISGGTDTHIVLLDLTATGMTGQRLQDVMYAANITCNKNPIPFDSPRPSEWAGVRLGSGAGTTRGFDAPEFEKIGNLIADLADAARKQGDERGLESTVASVRQSVADLCRRFPIYR